MEKSLKMRIKEWVEKVGRQEAEIELKARGVSKSMAQKLLACSYPNQPKIDIINALESAMRKGA